jgi:hypothetical protein
MVTLHIAEQSLTVEVAGLHKLWSFRSSLTIPLAHIVDAHLATDEARKSWHGWRVPGTHMPGLITAGTYYDGSGRVFWDVCDPARAIEIVLHDDAFARLVVEVEDPAAAIDLIQRAIAKAASQTR